MDTVKGNTLLGGIEDVTGKTEPGSRLLRRLEGRCVKLGEVNKEVRGNSEQFSDKQRVSHPILFEYNTGGRTEVAVIDLGVQIAESYFGADSVYTEHEAVMPEHLACNSSLVKRLELKNPRAGQIPAYNVRFNSTVPRQY